MSLSYDYIIAGGGSAGCTLASNLADKSDAKILFKLEDLKIIV